MPTLLTSDGVRIHARHLDRIASADPALDAHTRDLAIVVGHGFTGSVDRPAMQAVLARLRRHAGVIGLDWRGHGRSGGMTTLGDREIEDVDAAVRWARSLRYRRVATLGFSMGGAVVLRHGGLRGGVDAIVSASAPAWWHYRGTRAMRRLHWLIESGSGRAVSRVWRRTRIDPVGWADPQPVPPYEAAARLTVPLLVVHGTDDPFFPTIHAQTIFDAASDPKDLWLRTDLGHAEGAMNDDLLDEIGGWVRANAAARVRA